MKQILPPTMSTTASRSQQPVAETTAVQSQDRRTPSVPGVSRRLVEPGDNVSYTHANDSASKVPNDKDVVEPQPVDIDHEVPVHYDQDQGMEVVMPIPVSLQASESEPMPSSRSSGALSPSSTTGPCTLTSPVSSSRPRRMIKPNTKYDPETYDLTQ